MKQVAKGGPPVSLIAWPVGVSLLFAEVADVCLIVCQMLTFRR